MISCTYFMLTTLTSIGYGDMHAISVFEKLISLPLFIGGTGFVAYVLGTFREVTLQYEKIALIIHEKNVEADEIALQSWLILLTRYRDNKPLPQSLESQMYDHYRFYWTKDRLPPILENDFMEALPIATKRAIVANYVFDDVVFDYRVMLRSFDPNNSNDKMIEVLLYGLKPRTFSSEKERNVIYDEG